MDASSNRNVGRAGIVIHSLKEDEIECIIRLDFPTTNNEAEYKTLLAGLNLAKAVKATSMVVYCDSQVVTSQVNGDYKCKGEWIKKYLEQVWRWVGDLQDKFVQIPREENKQANDLAKAALAEHMLISSKELSFVQLLPLIGGMDVEEIGLEDNWTTPIV